MEASSSINSIVNFKDNIDDCIGGSSCPGYLDYLNIPIGCWNTSAISDMSYAFSSDTNKTSGTTDIMVYNFSSNTAFNEPINNCWDVASVSDMNHTRIIYLLNCSLKITP